MLTLSFPVRFEAREARDDTRPTAERIRLERPPLLLLALLMLELFPMLILPKVRSDPSLTWRGDTGEDGGSADGPASVVPELARRDISLARRDSMSLALRVFKGMGISSPMLPSSEGIEPSSSAIVAFYLLLPGSGERRVVCRKQKKAAQADCNMC